MPVGGAIIGSAVIGGVATTSAANRAAKTQTNAANQANQTLKDQQAQTRSDLSPWTTSGKDALTMQNRLMGLGTNADSTSAQRGLEQTPGYQFTLSQGLKAVGNANATRLGGGLAKGAANFATQLSNNTYGDQVSRYADLSKTGESAAAQVGAFGAQTASGVANNLTGAGNSQASAAIAGGNAISNIASSGGAAVINNPLIFNKLFGNSGTAGGTTSMYSLPGSYSAPTSSYQVGL
ncbi:hypothetical protein ABENE_23050 [Asticcacaulis benevestitus DSM 16100 = ATCC BAA-896]|uniref:DNA transfer protein n=1 Tax=Asticcacaulis benevestitus DSM 16100 = ATCC BAA-896 TaxID=1121022 RepID=V4NRU3_9CAUL|nr:hypothetical protein [Asticcacaulis benevestitus]ESQ78656.1 hypothetical protein ABENE_23050 [Asticcacaulis benevestitus DSM 16100 = ATCC BAA-896]